MVALKWHARFHHQHNNAGAQACAALEQEDRQTSVRRQRCGQATLQGTRSFGSSCAAEEWSEQRNQQSQRGSGECWPHHPLAFSRNTSGATTSGQWEERSMQT